MAEPATLAHDASRWGAIEMAINAQLSRARRQHRGWAIALGLVILTFVFFFGSSIAQAKGLGDAKDIVDIGKALISNDAANRLLALAPFGLGGFHALKQMSRADDKIEPLELCIVLVKAQDPGWKRAWHKANYVDEGDPAVMGMIESMV
ncbi:MAG: hypothetical protein AB7G04_02225 [Hyphomonadaceae bacterium]